MTMNKYMSDVVVAEVDQVSLAAKVEVAVRTYWERSRDDVQYVLAVQTKKQAALVAARKARIAAMG